MSLKLSTIYRHISDTKDLYDDMGSHIEGIESYLIEYYINNPQEIHESPQKGMSAQAGVGLLMPSILPYIIRVWSA